MRFVACASQNIRVMKTNLMQYLSSVISSVTLYMYRTFL